MSELLVIIFLLLAAVVLVGVIILASMHVYCIFQEVDIQTRMRQLRKPTQPWVTVLVYARNNEATIEASLKSLLRSHYHRFDIVVVDDGFADGTADRVRAIINKGSKVSMAYLRRRVHRSSREALIAGYKKSKKGEVVISLQAGIIVSPSFIKRAVVLKGQRPQRIVRVGEQLSKNSLLNIIDALNSLAWHYSYKAQVGDAKLIGSLKKSHHFDWASVFILFAIIFFSLLFNEMVIIWYSWLLVFGYLLAVIWLNEEKIVMKLQLTFSAISALFLLPVASLLTRISQLRSRN
ncbi:MAG: hypothetical protein JWO54_235 [Candidatus Saccharibacteria bacterium]|nr:hypothetical protein [Candidatus Saccharibacteria bacterium]MDB5180477.1 hypothetical protein [Candidatus Saccharibacteria bacterium]